MIKHVILWQLKDEYDEERKTEIRKGIKEGLEGLIGKVPGLLEVHVQTAYLPSSTADLMLECLMEDAAALKGYSQHPAHVAVANEKVRPHVKTRLCLDFEVQEDKGA